MTVNDHFVLFILIITSVLSGIIFIFSAVVVYFMHFRVLGTLRFMSEAASKGATRFSVLVYPDKVLERLATHVGGSMVAVNEDRQNFIQITSGNRDELQTPNPITDRGNFKTPTNVFDEVSFQDPEYQTIRNDLPNEEIFPKKDTKDNCV
ncbi:hypothetical protein M3Y98_00341900 [Aphelenchoides besseyi]|nr:hypothetical protein M3Y98_00341900 [Aphelenchoides besseyi]KAI6194368.1 hypothetical protein M3Y96_01117400 [Aphelenchoides besseyi]